MPKSRIMAAALLCSLVLSFTATAGAQDRSPAGTTKVSLKVIKIPSQIDMLLSFQEFILLTSKKGLALAVSSEGDYEKSIRSFRLSPNGKTKLFDTLSDSFENPPYLAAVWIDGASSTGASPAGKGYGLLFYGHDADDYSWAKVSLTKFSAAGKFTEDPVDFIHMTLPAGTDEIDIGSVKTAKGPHSVAVAVTIHAYNSTTSMNTVFGRFFETDFEGNIIGSIREIEFDFGDNQYAYLYKPAWSGKKWLVPVRNIVPTPTLNVSCRMLVVNSVAAAAPASGSGIEIVDIHQTGSPDSGVNTAQFLPQFPAAAAASAGPPASSRLNLVVQVFSRIPEHTNALTKSNFTYLNQQIKTTGSTVGKLKTMKINPWQRVLTPVVDMTLDDYREWLSNVLILDSNHYLAVKTAHIERKSEVSAPSGKYLDEGCLSLISFNNKLKQIKELYRLDCKGEAYPSVPPILRAKDGKYWIVFRTRDPENSLTTFYVGTFVL